MFIVEVMYGIESYQHERQEFDSYIDAVRYYEKCALKSPISLKMYQQIKSYSVFD